MSRERDLTSDRKSILFVAWNYPPRRGGVEEMVRQLFRHLSEAGPVTLLTGHPGGRSDDAAGVERAPLPGLWGFLCWILWRVPWLLLRGGPDVVLSSGALVGSIVEPMARLFRRPHAALVYGTDITYPARLYQLWLRWVLPSVPRLLPISIAVVDELRERGLIASDTAERLSPGVDPEMAEMAFDTDLPAPEVPVLLFVGRVIERKGLAPFVEHCLPRILERHEVELWVVGDEATESLAHRAGALATLKEDLAGSAAERHVRFLGSVSDETLRAAYRHASVLVLPAIEIEGDVEGFGIVFLEAALFGVPAVSARIGGIPDAVVDGVTGVLVEPGDWEAYATAVGDLLADESRRQSLGDRARHRAVSEYDWRRISNRCYVYLEQTDR